ncbi:SRPBCC family protein [Nevskia soli]|jgi:ligand-binding SRPBCC domain-containing protein|uniref:SRPBCC family protein n=1 Tax=Nevskia soli TaxID=418856 RepID=UPI0015D7BB1D|nr:SRPBCC family protein [Nevskia soli]
MTKHLYVTRLLIPRSAEEAFRWHEQPGALEKLIPPGEPVRVVEHRPGLQSPIGDGACVVLEIGHRPLVIRWVAIHEGYIAGRQFIDVQKTGPFAFWRHLHSFIPEGRDACTMEDHVEYALPMGVLGDAVAHARVRAQIVKMFAWRHRVTFDELAHGNGDR